MQILSLEAFLQGDAAAHHDFTLKLEDEGLTMEDIKTESLATLEEQQSAGLGRYYMNLQKFSPCERDCPLLAPAFNLYSNHVRLTAFERLNTLERETIKYYRKKYHQQVERNDLLEFEQGAVAELQDIISNQKKEFLQQKRVLESQIESLKEQWRLDRKVKQEKLESLIEAHQLQLSTLTEHLNHEVSLLQKELKVKDTIVRQQTETIEDLKIEIQALKYKLRIPRLHLQYLQQHGKLDEFIYAKIVGKDAEAKLVLLRAARHDIEPRAREILAAEDTQLKKAERYI